MADGARDPLAPQGPSLGSAISPQTFVQGPPPADQIEFTRLFDDAQTFLQRTDVRAALMQFAVANLQPRQPGTPQISAIAQAAGQGGVAAGRVQATEEKERKQGVVEEQRQQTIDLQERRTATGEERLGLDEKRFAADVKLREKAINAAESRFARGLAAKKTAADLAFERGKETRTEAARVAGDVAARGGARARGRQKIGIEAKADAAAIKAEADARARAASLEAARAKGVAKQIDGLREQLQLVSPGSDDHKRIMREIQQLIPQAQFDDKNAERMLRTLRGPTVGAQTPPPAPGERRGAASPPQGGVTPQTGTAPSRTGAIPTEAPPAPQGQAVSSPVVDQVIREERVDRAIELGMNGTIKYSPEQWAKLLAAKKGKETSRVAGLRPALTVDEQREIETLAMRARKKGENLTGDLGRQVVSILARTKDIIRTREDFERQSKRSQQLILTKLNRIFEEGAPPREDSLWQFVLRYPFLQEYLADRLPGGKAEVEEMLEAARADIAAGERARKGTKRNRKQELQDIEAQRRKLSGKE